MMTMGLRNKMLVMLLAPMIVILGGLSFYSYWVANDALGNQIHETYNYVIGDYVGELNSRLVDKENTINNLAAIIGSRPWTADETENLLKSVKGADKDIMNVFVAVEGQPFVNTNGWVPPAGYDPRERPWYKQAVAAGGVSYTDVYEDQATKRLTTSIAKKIVSNGRVIGVAGLDLNLEGYQELVKGIKTGETGYAFVINSKGDFLSHPSLKLTDNIFKIENGAFAEAGKQFVSGKTTMQRFTFGGVEKLYVAAPVGKTGWVLVIAVPVDELYAEVAAMGRTALVTSLVALLVLGLIIFFATVKITRPINNLAAVTQSLADGDLAIDTAGLVAAAPRDEIGSLIGDFHRMKEQLRELIRKVALATEQMAASSQELTASADQSAQAANQVAGSITDVARGAERQLNAVNDTSAVVQQMAATIHHIADNAGTVTGMSSQAAETAKAGEKSVEKAVAQIGQVAHTVNTSAQVVAKLGERSKEIGQIVDTISGIAGQTNLLALNAAIEAARAGEQGRGFAVVAEEVRKLAEQSQEAAKQIADMINEIQSDTDKAVVAMNEGTREVSRGTEVVTEAGKSFRGITALVLQVSDQIRDISAAIEQMASGSEQIVRSVKEIEDLGRGAAAEAQTVSAATEEQSASMEEIASSSQTLAQMAQELQHNVAKFRL